MAPKVEPRTRPPGRSSLPKSFGGARVRKHARTGSETGYILWAHGAEAHDEHKDSKESFPGCVSTRRCVVGDNGSFTIHGALAHGESLDSKESFPGCVSTRRSLSETTVLLLFTVRKHTVNGSQYPRCVSTR